MNALSTAIIYSMGGGLMLGACQSNEKQERQLPNILIAISDDQSWLHTSFAGCKFVNTPGFDRIARNGIYFTNCFAGSPGSAPSRSSLVTGRYHWQNEQSGQHASSWMNKHVPFVDLLEDNGYQTGFTGKGVGPFEYAKNKMDSLWRKENAAGKGFNSFQYKRGEKGDERNAGAIGGNNYFANFRDFMKKRNPGEPFYFWYGATEPLPLYGIDETGKHNSDWAFTDVDASPSKSYLVENYSNPEIRRFFDLAFAKRPEYELYDALNDPCCLNNLSDKAEFVKIEQEMKTVLLNELESSF